jgi:hypothetical protein
MSMRLAKDLSPTYPACLIVDADEERAQRLARLLTLTDYRPLVVSTLSQALERSLREPFQPHALLLGQADLRRHPLFSSLVRRVEQQTGKEIPRLLIQTPVPEVVPVGIDSSIHSPTHVLSQRCLQILSTLGELVPPHRTTVAMTAPSLVLDILPALELFPRVAHHRHVGNRHLLQMLTTARILIGEEQWENVLRDAGLAQYQRVSEWPAQDDDSAIPLEYLSLLHQAVAFSRSEHAVDQLRQWGSLATEVALQQHRPSLLTLQALKLLPQERVICVLLESFTRRINELRGEALHVWRQRPDGAYWLVHYSNLYVYGRIARFHRPACQIWIASLERILHLSGLGRSWEANERECSCLTLTGHCVFEIKLKHAYN